jgi:hypothetical protein
MSQTNLNLDFTTPLIFADSTAFWNKISAEHITHKKAFSFLDRQDLAKRISLKIKKSRTGWTAMQYGPAQTPRRRASGGYEVVRISVLSTHEATL